MQFEEHMKCPVFYCRRVLVWNFDQNAKIREYLFASCKCKSSFALDSSRGVREGLKWGY